MNTLRTMVVIGGVLMLIGGVVQLWFIVRRRGRGPWRGAVVSALALAMYGLLAVTGIVLNGAALGAALVWAIAGVMWFGWWLTRRDTARPGREGRSNQPLVRASRAPSPGD